MRWRESLVPVAMRRVALVAPTEAARRLLVEVADSGAVQVEQPVSSDPVRGPANAAMRRLRSNPATPAISETVPDLAQCEHDGRLDLIAGEAELENVLHAGVRRGSVIGFVGWARTDDLSALAKRVAPLGGAAVGLRRPPGVQPPTLLSPESPGRAFAPLVQTYATPPYRDIDPSVLAGLAYVAMFGMMFADLGHGALLLAGALAVRFGHWKRLAPLRRVWVMLAGAGASSMVFGALYGEFFGPTGVVPVIWLEPVKQPVPLLLAAIAIGALLLAGAYVLGTVNRFREGGWRKATYAPSGVAGAGVFVGVGLIAAGVYWDLLFLTAAGSAVVGIALALVTIGFFVEAGGGFAGGAQAGVELFDLVIRLGSNVVSFARLAAFGLTHAALGQVVWDATVGSWRHGVVGVVGAVVVFAVGNALTFSLEAVIAGIQALRLEYYELFSRVFVAEGEPFRPWHVPVERYVATPAASVGSSSGEA